MFYREKRLKEPLESADYSCTMTEILFELWVERQIDYIDHLYMNDELTDEEYCNKMNELNKREYEFINNLYEEKC